MVFTNLMSEISCSEGEKLDDSRCFNCSSYGHGLKDCPMPRDNVAVNSARKQHRSQRNQSANSRNSVRYYQSSRGGKYEGLTPGVLDPETRQLLGLGVRLTLTRLLFLCVLFLYDPL